MCLKPNCHCIPRGPEYTSENHSKKLDKPKHQEEEKVGDEEEEDEYEVEKIVAKRFKKGQPEYQVKWKNWPESTNTWEPKNNLNCHDLLDAYENNLKKGEKKTIVCQYYDVKRKAQSVATANTSAKVQDTRPRGFKRGLCAEKIVGATNDPGELHFLLKWRGSEEMDLIPAHELNAKLPGVVIKFYEERLNLSKD